jgi:hypothetical protein
MEYKLFILEISIVFIVLEVYAMAKKIVKKPVPKDGAKKKLQKEALKKESHKGSPKKSPLKDSVSKKTKVQKPAPKAKASVKAVSAKPIKKNIAKKVEPKKLEAKKTDSKKSAKPVVEKKTVSKAPQKALKAETPKVAPTMVTTKGKGLEKTTDKKASVKKNQAQIDETPEVVEETVVAPTKKKKEASLENFVFDKETVKWQDLKKKFGHIEAREYNMREVFEANIPILHKVLGWGFVISVLNDRLEVLFEQGIKNLISNYKQV